MTINLLTIVNQKQIIQVQQLLQLNYNQHQYKFSHPNINKTNIKIEINIKQIYNYVIYIFFLPYQ